MGEGRKALKKVLGWKAYMMREKEEKKESISWKWKKWEMLTNEDQASLNSQKKKFKQYQSGDKALFAFWPTVVNS